ncbi:hypothetical protein [Vulcanisaeta thermophila]|uniref:hypothetical protein n=1 Tax=Vulcanisaeta thermophila TaxID=867917 RepID=UPI0008534BA3|nr:hypothetical protein [Vulcanisaeta thermophila]
MGSFDKVGKSIIEEHYQTRRPINETTDLTRLIVKIRNLETDDLKTLCRWINLGIIENAKVTIDPLGTVTFMDWSQEYDSLIHGLVELGIASVDLRGSVTVPLMMQWYNALGDVINGICTDDEADYYGEYQVRPSPMYMAAPVGKEIEEYDYEDFVAHVYHRLRSLGSYISGKVIYVGVNVKSLGLMNQVVFRTPVDLLVMTNDHSIIAHRILDPNRTVHRGYSAVEDYLMSGFDYALIVHGYVGPRFHEEVVNNILNKPRIVNAGYAVVAEDSVLFYKWPRINELPRRSPTVGMSRSLIINNLKFLVRGQ